MRQRTESRWVRLRKDAIDKAEELACRTSNDLPTNLGKIATRQGVHAIQFRPLLSDGGIAVSEDGFLIYVKADSDQGEDLTAQFAEDGVGAGLPRQMIRRARFTIAHEIAHTFFYDTHLTPPKPKIELKNATSVRSLERVCNSVAGTLLLPEAFLEREFSDADLSQPSELSRLADVALISNHALVRRLQELRRFPHPIAIVACIEWNEGQWVIKSVSRHYSLRGLFKDAEEGAALTELVDHPDFLPNGGAFPEVDVELGERADALRMRFFCDPAFRQNTRRSFYVTGIRLN